MCLILLRLEDEKQLHYIFFQVDFITISIRNSNRFYAKLFCHILPNALSCWQLFYVSFLLKVKQENRKVNKWTSLPSLHKTGPFLVHLFTFLLVYLITIIFSVPFNPGAETLIFA